MYSALLQMVRLILQERTLDCSCKRRHAQKYASVLIDIKHAVLGCEYLLYLLRLNDMYSIELSFQ